MKTIFVTFAALLVSASAFAMPTIGDHSVFNLSYTQQGNTMTGTLDQSITAFDSASGNYTVHSIVTLGKQNDVQDQQTNQLLDDATVADILANCANYQGQPQSVTVPAGTFNTCALPNNGNDGSKGTVWVGNVSFGTVKFDQVKTDGTHIVLELQSFQLGK